LKADGIDAGARVLSGILYEEANIWEFFFITFILGGWAAWMTGRACAQTWRSYGSLFFYLLLLGIAVRFIHHALFGGTMFSLHFYLVDTVILMVLGFVGYRYTRTNQMVRQYGWLYERVNPLAWKARA
jgi:small-conductance mechanosensitive channel